MNSSEYYAILIDVYVNNLTLEEAKKRHFVLSDNEQKDDILQKVKGIYLNNIANYEIKRKFVDLVSEKKLLNIGSNIQFDEKTLTFTIYYENRDGYYSLKIIITFWKTYISETETVWDYNIEFAGDIQSLNMGKVIYLLTDIQYIARIAINYGNIYTKELTTDHIKHLEIDNNE